MAHLPIHSYGINKHNCGYSQLTDLVIPAGHNTSSKTRRPPPRPKTRRHPQDSPHRPPEIYSRASGGNKSSLSCSKYPSKCTGYSNGKNKFKNSDLYSRNHSSVEIPDSTAGSSCPSTCRNVRTDKVRSQGKFKQTYLHVHSEGEEQKSCAASENIPSGEDAHASLEEHEYLQFLLRITEDIIKNDLYSNKEMKKVFTSHVKANSGRLELDRMLLRIHELMKELNIPLGIDIDENSSASWTDIATVMRGLLCLENMKSHEHSNKNRIDSRNQSSAKEKCICFDLRSTYPVTNAKNNATEEEIEHFNYDSYTPMTKFGTSLDRLTEHTEPPSSRATCKISTSFSNFGDVDVLPGFECLENSKFYTELLCEPYTMEKATKDSIKTVSHCQVSKKRRQIRKHKLKRRKKLKHIKKTDEVKKNKTTVISKNQNTQVETENLLSGISVTKYNETPIIITLQEYEEKESSSQGSGNDPFLRNSKHDYIFINGPIYLLRRFLEENPQTLIENKKPSRLNSAISSKINPQREDTNLIEHVSDNSEKTTEIENEEELASEDENNKPQYFEDIKDIILELTKFSKCTNSLDEKRFHYVDLNDVCGRLDYPEGAETVRLCKKTCPHKSVCNRLKLASPAKEINSWNDEYDFTPQKEHQEEIRSHFTPVISPTIIRNFLATRSIQTDDIPYDPTIVGAVLIARDETSDTDNMEVDSEESRSHDPEKMRLQHTTQPASEQFEIGKEMTDPTNSNIMLMATEHSENPDGSHSESADKQSSSPQNQEIARTSSDTKIPIVSSYQTDGTLPTLESTATVERTEQYLEIEEEIQRKTVSPLFSLMTEYADEIGENRHLRKVSILKNPIIQVPIDKIFGENDDSKKKQESIIRTVGSLKDRQTSRDPYLDKVLHEIESSRETRVPERMVSTEVSEKSEPTAMPGHSALKSTGKSAYYTKDENTSDSSYDELPFKINSIQQKDANYGTAGIPTNKGVSSEVASEQNFLSQLDEQAEMRGSPSQIRQINKVTAKLDQFRHANDRDEAEISATLDKLVQTLKNQQENEEDVQEKNYEGEAKKIPDTSRKNPLRCCGLCKKKRVASVVIYNEPLQMNTFSEQEYKAKSEAFELALTGLGQKQKTPENEETKEKVNLKEDEGQKANEYFGTSPIVHSGNRLSLVRIADERENDMETMNADFEEISTKISNDRIRQI